MSHGKIQVAPQTTVGNRVITISRPQHPDDRADSDDPLFINVLRRRWMLLTFCVLLSAAAGLMMISQFSLPKATTNAQLRYVELPPTLAGIYKPPGMLEFTEILLSNETLNQLAKRTGQQVSPKFLRRCLELRAGRFSNIINIEMRWRDGKQAIDIVNELMAIASETISANRKQTLATYAVETELQYEAAHQRVVGLRDRYMKLRQEHEPQILEDGTLPPTTQALMMKIDRIDASLDDLTLRRLATDRQLATLRGEVDALHRQIKAELISGRVQQAASRKRLYAPNSERYRRVEEVEQQLRQFEVNGDTLDYTIWRAKLGEIGAEVLGPPDPASAAAVMEMERQLASREARIEQMEFDMLPMDSNRSLLESRREALERELNDALGETDMSTVALEEARNQLDQAQETRSRLYDELQAIRRGEETDFSEMTVLTPASWQTTEQSEGKPKLFVFTFVGCLIVLVIPVFALEHFYPSGDPAEHAAKSLGVPLISNGTFVTQRLKRDRSALHPVNSEAMRLLALRIQQSVHGPGAMVLFSGLNHEKSSIPMISYLAECLARREERVLIIDACDRPQDSDNRTDNDDSVNAVLAPRPVSTAETTKGTRKSSATKSTTSSSAKTNHTVDLQLDELPSSEAKLPVDVRQPEPAGVLGLADFLHRRELQPDEMICATSIPGVDIIPCGTMQFPREGFASSSLSGLLDECRQRYTMILVAGPSTEHPSDLQMLSARADGILFTVPPNGRPAGKGEEVVRDLLELGAPVIGIVS